MTNTTATDYAALRTLVQIMREEGIANADRVEGTLRHYQEDALTAAAAWIEAEGSHYADFDQYEDVRPQVWDSLADWAQELCEDVGYVSDDTPWWIEVDWHATAGNMLADYGTANLPDGRVAIWRTT